MQLLSHRLHFPDAYSLERIFNAYPQAGKNRLWSGRETTIKEMEDVIGGQLWKRCEELHLNSLDWIFKGGYPLEKEHH